MPSSCSCAKPPSAASSSSLRMPSLQGRTGCGPGRKLLSTAGEDAAGVHCGTEATPGTVLGCTWARIPASHGEWSPALRAASVFQDGCVPHHAQPDVDHALWKCHCVCHRGALWPVGARQKVRERSVCWWREGEGGPPALTPICLPDAMLSSCANHAFRRKCCQRTSPCCLLKALGGRVLGCAEALSFPLGA